MADVAFLGMRASSDFTVEGQRPKNWRETILRLYPNGKAPLTALLALAKSEKTDDPEFNWFCKELPSQAGPVLGVYSTDTMGTALAAGKQTVGTVLYVKMNEADVRQFLPHHTVLLRGESAPELDTFCIIEDTKKSGANSYVKVKLLQDTEATFASAVIKRILVVGSANEEGAIIGQAVAYDPFKVHNYTQIFRNPLEITRTAKETKLRTGSAYNEAKREALELHSIEMEKAFIFGVPSENNGANGKPQRTTGGIIWAIKNHGGTVAKYSGTWKSDGLDWLEEQLMTIFRYGETDKLGFVGDAALLAINRLAREKGTWQYTTSTKSFGINIGELITPFGQLTLKTHPLFSYEPSNRHSLLLFEPKNIRYRYITDTKFFSDDEKHGHNRYDGLKEEYLTEAGLEFHFPKGWAWFNNLGVSTTTVTP